MHRLVPVASDLVGRHFERTLRTRALARMGDDPADAAALGGGLVVVARRLDVRVDTVAVFAAATDRQRALWIRPDRGTAVVGLGAVESITPVGDGRFSAASAARAALAARVHRVGPADAPAPLLLGGFAFSAAGWSGPAATGDRGPDWTGFPDAAWVLPERTYVDRPDGSWLLAAARVEAGRDEAATIDLLDERIDAAVATLPPAVPVDLEFPDGEVRVDGPTAASYESLVADAVTAIGAGELGKVVLARTHEEPGIDATAVLARLRARYPSCAVFSFAVDDRQFLGASPEQLVALDGRQVTTAALAGTTGVGWDDTTDAGLAAEMLASAKIRAEHQFVVDDITARLAALGLVGETPPEPEVLRLARVQHLRTPITARVERRAGGVSDMDVLRVAGVLHPTPAVAGTPTAAAVSWLEAREAFDRGWYAAPVGWCDLDGNGELRVALRSALVDGDGTATLFSGAGIVADSVPADELAETGVKLRALLDVMDR
jgi:isochorismate synthase